MVDHGEEEKSFKELGVCDQLVEACHIMGWKTASKIQAEVIPHALKGKDIIGLAQTGSGKTGAFAIPILQAFLASRPSQEFFACVLSPTRELADQICQQFKALGAGIGVTCETLVGGLNPIRQFIILARRPNILVATPGCLLDHLSKTEGFSLHGLKCLVLDEADKLLNADFEKALNGILSKVTRERTYLFSATMNKKVDELKRACLTNPVKVEAASKNPTVDTLKQHYHSLDAKYKEKRTGALNKFKAGERNILICTDVASRGLDIPSVDVVINYDIPTNPQDYIHRVGRTARAGRSGVAISLVNQYELDWYLQIEKLIGKKLSEYPAPEEQVLVFLDRVTEAKRISRMKIKESGVHKKRRGGDEQESDAYFGGGIVCKPKSSSKKPRKRG